MKRVVRKEFPESEFRKKVVSRGLTDKNGS